MRKTCVNLLFLITAILWRPSFAQEPGMISVNSIPTGARVILNGKDTEKHTPFMQALTPGKYTVVLKLENFREHQEEFTISNYDIKAINVTLQPLYGMAGITSDPSGARVFLDGKLSGTTPLIIQKVPVGNHTVRLTKEMFDDLDTTFSNEDGKPLELNLSLKSNSGMLGIVAYPDADILINGKKAGNRIYAGQHPPGIYKIEAIREGYTPELRIITMEQGKDLNLSFELQKIIQDTGEKITFTTYPAGAEVFTGMEKPGVTPCTVTLKKGKHTVTFRLPGYKVLDSSIEVTKEDHLHFVMVPETHEIQIVSTPAQAKVFLNDNPVGVTPYKGELTPGNALVKITKRGYNDLEKPLQVTSGTNLFNFTLEPADMGKSKGKAVLYSALFPGAGQSYLMDKKWPSLLGVAALGCAAGGFYLDSQSGNTYEQYKIQTSSAEKRMNLLQTARDQQDLSKTLIAGAAGIYAVNLIWVLILPEKPSPAEGLGFTTGFNTLLSTPEFGITVNF